MKLISESNNLHYKGNLILRLINGLRTKGAMLEPAKILKICTSLGSVDKIFWAPLTDIVC